MKIENIDINDTLEKARQLLNEEKTISSAFKAVIEILLLIITLLVNRLNLNSKNSSRPPSTDQYSENKSNRNQPGRKPGGQKGHPGSNLNPVENPDEIKSIMLNRKSLPKSRYRVVGYSARQVIDIRISRYVIEYRAEILENTEGVQFVAPFPEQVTRPVQYGVDLKAHSVYLSQFQLLTYHRIDDYFDREIKIPISPGSILNFNK